MQDQSKKKVLILNGPIQYGGSDLVAVRLQQNLDKDKFECTYCIKPTGEDAPMEPIVAATGVRIIHQPKNEANHIKSFVYYLKLLRREHFDIIHCHLPFFSGIVSLAGKLSGIKKIVAHSHFSQPLIYSNSKLHQLAGNIYRKVMRLLISLFTTDIIGCSEDAGVYLAGKKGFAKKGIVLNNGIDTDLYKYDEAKRTEIRKSLGIENKTVIGHIGQMYYVKNHEYLIDVFYDYQKRNENAVLMLISDGPDRDKLEEKVKRLAIENKVMFLGFRDDIPDLLLAMDCFVFPSIHEGFPLTLIEAQASKLPCLVSDSVTKTAKLNSNVDYLSIKLPASEWSEKIEELLMPNRNDTDSSKVIQEFDIKNIAKKLENIYLR